jgi:hypothetical protein
MYMHKIAHVIIFDRVSLKAIYEFTSIKKNISKGGLICLNSYVCWRNYPKVILRAGVVACRCIHI